ncbi:NAC domain-containing protein 35-like [Salvia splendens]|uniref:NAC domain-containing protein 35-like n=1 Tax=Salvia splendens TaxID=180675 RepID=UPI001C268156|nr:NAC domain-containing protein 35-like [Salvia splendens]
MAIGAAMNNQEDSRSKQDEHENDVVMPGFRFHPTEEELVEFYLRRKVEGKRFNVELITFLDLYRYDPWELPALAAIGEKEWYFYVPRDRKYRNGDRPNRVTTSGYWKATGADRMIRSENLRSIGLKKTLVFYSGKAPKGIRTSWIMNEFRLPHHDTERLQKAEISLCRVYKRAGVEDHLSLPRCLPTKAAASSSSSSRGSRKQQPETSRYIFQANADGKLAETSPTSSTDIGTSLALSHYTINPLAPNPIAVDGRSKQPCPTEIFAAASNSNAIDDLHKLVNNYSSSIGHYNPANAPNLVADFTALQPQAAAHPGSLPAAAYSDRLWEWGAISESEAEAGKDLSNLFK